MNKAYRATHKKMRGEIAEVTRLPPAPLREAGMLGIRRWRGRTHRAAS